jgi:hypothetical protein
MTIKTRLITVTDTPTLLHAKAPDAKPGAGFGITVPTGGVTVFFGGPDVTATGPTQGWPIRAGGSFFPDLDTGNNPFPGDTEDAPYAVVASGLTQAVNTILTGVMP